MVAVISADLSSMNQFIAFWLLITPKDLNTPLVIDQNVTYILYGLEKQQLNNQIAYKRTDLY